MGKILFKIAEKFFFFRKSIIILIVLFLTNPLYSLSTDSTEKKKSRYFEYRPENILGFAKDLISQGEYYRALVELKRLQLFYPDYLRREHLYISEVYLLFKGKQFRQIVRKKNNSDDLVCQSIDRIFKYDAHIYSSDFEGASSILSHELIGYDNNLDKYIIKRWLLTDILKNRIDSTEAFLQRRKVDVTVDVDKYRELMDYSARKYSSMKNPNMSLFYGIIPGMGYVYSGRKPTGILALVVISVFSTLTYLSFKTDNGHIGIFLGAATTFFYSGSIVGGYLESKKYNERTMKEVRDYLVDELSLENDREVIFKRYGLPE
jgi:hypothetical protein